MDWRGLEQRKNGQLTIWEEAGRGQKKSNSLSVDVTLQLVITPDVFINLYSF